jgi:uncharacterized membrane protein
MTSVWGFQEMLARRSSTVRATFPQFDERPRWQLSPWPDPGLHVTLSSVTSAPTSRLAWIDWMRGLACVLMFQTHCYDAWLGGAARNGGFLQGSQLLGTLPAPLFLFLAGISFALVTSKLISKNVGSFEITRSMARRGAEILAFGLLFRLQEFLIAWGWAPWSDLFRVDILNIIGLSMILMALTCGLTLGVCGNGRGGFAIATVAFAVTSLIALLTPLVYTTWRPTWLRWPIESYIDGCHNLGFPQSWIFPFFPWGAFAFAGLATGFVLFGGFLFNDRPINDLPTQGQASGSAGKTLSLLAALGIAAIVVAYEFDHSSFRIYSTYDYWHTSPNFLMMRIGLLLVIAFLSYAWCRWGLATRGFSPLIQLGQTSLLVYWVHMEFVYGRFSILPKRAESIPTASRGLLEIFLFMLIISLVRTRIDWKRIDWKRIMQWKKLGSRVQPA